MYNYPNSFFKILIKTFFIFFQITNSFCSNPIFIPFAILFLETYLWMIKELCCTKKIGILNHFLCIKELYSILDLWSHLLFFFVEITVFKCEIKLTILNEAKDLQQVLSSQDPLTPWHLHSTFIFFSSNLKQIIIYYNIKW